MPPAIDVMNMDQPSPRSAVITALTVILATREVPRGGAASLYFASTSFTHEGGLARAKLCGEASVAILRLEKAIREEDSRQQLALVGVISGLLDQWHGLESVDPVCHPDSQAAA